MSTILILLVLWINLVWCVAFTKPAISTVSRCRLSSNTPSALGLVPLINYRKDITFFDQNQSYRCCLDEQGKFKSDSGDVYELGVVDEDDLPDLSRFVIQVFGADAIRLSQDLNSFERLIMKPAAELLNNYSFVVAFAEVLGGLSQRCSARFKAGPKGYLTPPKLKGLTRPEKLDVAQSTSVVLALAKDVPGSEWHVDVIGSVELRLQPSDAKIPFTLPWLDRIERRLGSLVGIGKDGARDLQPYLSNLCVDDKFRGKGIGRALVRCVEDIAHNHWGYARMYLHVDADNKAAYELYKSEGYRDVGLRWKPFWAGKAADIGYFVKDLKAAKKGVGG